MTPPDDAMGADEARALLARADVTRRECAECRRRDAEADAEGRHVECPSPDGPGVVGAWRECLGPEESVRALRAVVALHARAGAAWQAGAEAARAGDVAALREHAARLRRDARLGAVILDAAKVDAARAVGDATDALARSPLPAPPAPPQSPEAPPDGGTEPGGGGAPARGLPVAAAGDTPGRAWERGRLAGLDEAAAILRAEADARAAQRGGLSQHDVVACDRTVGALRRVAFMVEGAKALVSATKGHER